MTPRVHLRNFSMINGFILLGKQQQKKKIRDSLSKVFLYRKIEYECVLSQTSGLSAQLMISFRTYYFAERLFHEMYMVVWPSVMVQE